MVEFSEKLDVKYEGAQALIRRIEYRAFCEKYVIPYSMYGVDYSLFTSANPKFKSSLEEVMRDLNVPISIIGDHVQIAQFTINPRTMEIL